MVFPKDVIFSGANLYKKKEKKKEEILESHRNRAKHIKREPFLVCLFEGKFGCYTLDTYNFDEQGGGHKIGKSENEKANTAV